MDGRTCEAAAEAGRRGGGSGGVAAGLRWAEPGIWNARTLVGLRSAGAGRRAATSGGGQQGGRVGGDSPERALVSSMLVALQAPADGSKKEQQAET